MLLGIFQFFPHLPLALCGTYEVNMNGGTVTPPGFTTARRWHAAFISLAAAAHRPFVRVTQPCFNIPTATYFVPPVFRNCRSFCASSPNHAKMTVRVPPMAESIHEGTLVSLHAQVGAWVDADGELGDIETDKVNVPITCPEAGKIVELMVAAGDLVKVGQAVAILETVDGASSDHGARKLDRTAVSQQTALVHEPADGPNGRLTERHGKHHQSSPTLPVENRTDGSFKKGERVVSSRLV